MAGSSGGSVRMGPISLFALVILLCIAVMGMLAASTGHAALASAQKQASNISDVYENESKAWELVADIDEALSGVRENGGGKWAAEQAAKDVADEYSDVSVEDGVVSAEFTTDNGKKLVAEMDINDNATLSISKWEVYTERDTDNGDVLWTGM